MRATVLWTELEDGNKVAVLLRLHDGTSIQKGDVLLGATPDGPCDMASGEYVGPEERFKGRRALVRRHPEGIVSAQFNEGEMWETHSWITFPEDHWSFEVL